MTSRYLGCNCIEDDLYDESGRLLAKIIRSGHDFNWNPEIPVDPLTLKERERCEGIVRQFLQYATKPGTTRDECISAMRGALEGLNPESGKEPLSRQQEMLDWEASIRMDEQERCANIAEAVLAEAIEMEQRYVEEESWQSALNEMSDSVNTQFCAVNVKLQSTPERIRSGE